MRDIFVPKVESVTEDFDIWLGTLRSVTAAIKAARAGRWFATHYRESIGQGTFVGAAATAWTPGLFGLFTGANQNLSPEDENWTKMCAERIALQKMVNSYGKRAPKLLTLLAVSGNVQADKQSELHTLAISTCALERELFQKKDVHFNPDGFVSEDTIMLNVHPDAPIFEVNTHYGAQSAHALKDENEIKSYYDPDFRGLEIADRVYLTAVDESLARGVVPDRAALVLQAMTGQLATSYPRPTLIDRQELPMPLDLEELELAA